LSWLKAWLVEYSKLLDSRKSTDRADVRTGLLMLKAQPNLAEVRDAHALAELPESERTAWSALWAEVDALLAKARGDWP
jgi:hypothetical protein